MVRADPVYASLNRLLRFVLLFTDLTERKPTEAARRRFQEGVIEQHRLTATRFQPKAHIPYQDLLSSVLENAQLARSKSPTGSTCRACRKYSRAFARQ
jgi:two-component system, chemotaxis family, sensor kinase Cph1